MKKLIAFLLVVLMVLVLYSVAKAYTFDGDIDPQEFNDWNVSGIQASPYLYVVHIYREDPGINKAVVYLAINGTIIAYSYTKDSKEYYFLYDKVEDAYIEVKNVPKDKVL